MDPLSPQPVSPQPAQIPPMPESSHRASLVAFGAVALIIIIGVVAWFGFGWRFPSKPAAEQAGNVFDTGNLEAALKAVDDALAKDPNDVNALINKAITLAQKGSLEFKEIEYGMQAAAVATQAIQLDPKSSNAWRALAYANEIQQKYTAAHQYYAKAIGLDSRNALAIFGDSHSYDLEGELGKAELGYRAALVVDPYLVEAHMGLARILDAKGDADGALAELNKAYYNTSNFHQKAEIAYSIGNLIFGKGQLALSRQYFEQATELDPGYPMGWYGLGGVLFAQGTDRDNALSDADRGRLMQSSIDVLNKALSLNPNLSLGYLRLGIEYSLTGQITKAVDALSKGVKAVPLDISLNAVDKVTVAKRIESLLTEVQKAVK